MDSINIKYRFKLPDGHQEVLKLELDPETMELRVPEPESQPDWTRLEFNQCSHCPLNPKQHPYCPMATRLAPIVAWFNNLASYDAIHMEVETGERRIDQKTTAQKGISSLFGLLMATSGCPKTAYFKPMARFHVPLAGSEETVFRAVSMYLLAQYFVEQQGHTPDFTLKGLKTIYEDLQTVNLGIVQRIRATSTTDSSTNAVIILDMYARSIPFCIDESLEEIQYLFTPYLEKHKASSEDKRFTEDTEGDTSLNF